MPSPFPGMDPYLEAHWRDVHASLIIYSRDALNGVLPKSLRARVEERVLLETPLGIASHPLYPDVRVVEYDLPRLGGGTPSEVGIAVADPIIVATEVEPPTETFIEIIDVSSGNRVVTVIEFLSPANKSPGPNREQFLRKQREICASSTNLVEIDLNRFGIHSMAFPLMTIQRDNRAIYIICVRRATRRGEAELYPVQLWERLPAVKIPLRPSDKDVPLDLRALIEQCYRNGGYEDTFNYSVDPDPPLLGTAKKWADKWLRDKGLRKGKLVRDKNDRARKRT